MLSLVRNDPLHRLQRRVGLVPAEGLGLGRRVLFWSALTWLPIMVWAAATGRLPDASAGDPVFRHFGVHVRTLFAIPLFILAEGSAHKATTGLLPELLRTGIVPQREKEKFDALLARIAALKDSSVPWIVALAVTFAIMTIPIPAERAHEFEWSGKATSDGYGFGTVWFLWVSRPVFSYFALAWIWRIVLLFKIFAGVSRLDLELVPTHPDRMGGLSCLDRMSSAFSLVALAFSAAVCANWAHEVLYHSRDVQTLAPHAAALVVVLLAVFLSPYFTFVGRLLRLKNRALLDYAALVGNHGRIVDRRWIRGKKVEERDILDAPELGPVADIHQLFHAVNAVRPLPLTLRTVAFVLVPAALPIIGVFAIQIPFKEILLGLLKAVA